MSSWSVKHCKLYEGGNLADLCDIGSGDNFPRFRRQEHLALFVVGEVSV